MQTPITHNQLTNVVPGALKWYDLPELAATLAPRPLTIRQAVDAVGKALDQGAVEGAYMPVRAAYHRLEAEKSLALETLASGGER